jgi:hypothetical protein
MESVSSHRLPDMVAFHAVPGDPTRQEVMDVRKNMNLLGHFFPKLKLRNFHVR